jgi:pilus assembly protein CpaF
MTSGSPALARVEADVRELLVRRDLPLDEDATLQALVEEVVADYRDRYLDGGLPPLGDHEVGLLRQRILGFGALTPLLG